MARLNIFWYVLDAKILPRTEGQPALYVPSRQELAYQALLVPGWGPLGASEDFPSLEGSSVTFSHAFFKLLE